MKQVKVKWVAPEYKDEWMYLPMEPQERICNYSVGFLVREDEDTITIAQSVEEGESQVDGLMTIPRLSIIMTHTARGWEREW